MRVAIIAALLLAGVALAAVEKETPHLIVSKTVSATDVVIGTPVTVTVSALNVGTKDALNVHLIDTNPLLQTAEAKSTESLAVGENVTLTYVFTPTELGVLRLGSAEVSYVAAAGESTSLKAFSNFVREEEDLYRGEADEIPAVRGVVVVLTADEYEQLHGSKIKEIAAYLFFAAISLALPYMNYRNAHSRILTLIRESKKK